MTNQQLLRENFRISVQAIRTNGLRTVLTILIIAIGITALVGTLTAIDAIEVSITKNFAQMGSNTFSIQSPDRRFRPGGHRDRKVNKPEITYSQAINFKRRFGFPATVSVSVIGTGTATVKFGGEKSNPNVRVVGIDENFLRRQAWRGHFCIFCGLNYEKYEFSLTIFWQSCDIFLCVDVRVVE